MEAAAGQGMKPPLYVVGIRGRTSDGAPVQGSGFIVSAHGHVATCKHVVVPDGDEVRDLHVKLPYPAEKPYAYRVIGTSGEDIALLESTVALDFPVPLPLIPAERTRAAEVGDAITVWGYSAAEHYTSAQRFDGNVSGHSGAHGRIGLSISINPGDSGGPVLDRDRYVIGIAQARDANREGQAMAIPISLLGPLLREFGVSTVPASAIFEAPEPDQKDLVGRSKLLGALKETLAAGRHVALCFKPGVGKSALAIALANDPALRVRFDGGVLWATLNLNPEVLSELQKWGAALRLPTEKMNELGKLATSLKAGDEKARHEVERQWARELNRQIGERRMLLVIDDAWELSNAKTMLLNAPNCGHVVTTREQYAVAQLLGDRFETTVVDELTENDAYDLLQLLAPNAVAMFPDEARKIYPLVGGLPLGLILLGKVLGAESQSGRRSRILKAYENIQANPEKYLEPLTGAIDVSYGALPDDETRWALQALSIFRAKPNMFSEQAALAVLDKPQELIDRLHDAGLIEVMHVGPDPHDLPYTMHRAIAEYARAKLPAGEGPALHRRAATCFATWLKQYEQTEQDPASYAYQYRYENPQWQDAMDNYLYHLAHSGDTASAILDFGSIYFNAFWWWGCFAEFPFSTRLLQQAAAKRLSEHARQALSYLAEFDAAYPKESSRDGGGDWHAVEVALTQLRELGGLEGEVGVGVLADADARHTRAITDIFLAEAFRFGREDYATAEHWYRDAAALLPDSDWSKPWALYHLGDMYLDAGRYDEASRACADCLALAEDPQTGLKERDNEVLSVAYRLRAELALQCARHDEVVPSCERSVLYAYAFQAIPQPPDIYTVPFYGQVSGRIAKLLQATHRADPARALAYCRQLRDYWSSYRQLAHVEEGAASPAQVEAMLRASSSDPLCAYLFPAAPAPEDMGRLGSRYFNEAITILNEKLGAA